MERSQLWGRSPHQHGHGAPAVPRGRSASFTQLQAVERSGVRGEGARHHRAVPEPAGSRARAVRGREEPDPALERTQPLLPMGFGYVEGVTHDYVRHGPTPDLSLQLRNPGVSGSRLPGSRCGAVEFATVSSLEARATPALSSWRLDAAAPSSRSQPRCSALHTTCCATALSMLTSAASTSTDTTAPKPSAASSSEPRLRRSGSGTSDVELPSRRTAHYLRRWSTLLADRGNNRAVLLWKCGSRPSFSSKALGWGVAVTPGCSEAPRRPHGRSESAICLCSSRSLMAPWSVATD